MDKPCGLLPRAPRLEQLHGLHAVTSASAAMSSAFGGPRTVARAPEKGVFPLDHFAECKQVGMSVGMGGEMDLPPSSCLRNGCP